MCTRCRCDQYLRKGKPAVLKRASQVIAYLQVTAENVDDYEATETICKLIAPIGSRDDEVLETAAWVSGLHLDTPRAGGREYYDAHIRAFQDIFDRLPVKGNPRAIATTWHQLEQLSRELDTATLASAEPGLRDVVEAVKRVHQGNVARTARLRKRYGL